MSGSTIQRRYVFGPGDKPAPAEAGEALTWYEGSGTGDRRWYHADERGSVIAVSDYEGKAIAVNSYDENGVPSPFNTGRLQYTGQAWLPEFDMYDYKARIYAPGLGRFMQTDPIGYDAGLNLYGYVGGDPINLVDPSGLADVRVVGYRPPVIENPNFVTLSGSAIEALQAVRPLPPEIEDEPKEVVVTALKPPKPTVKVGSITLLPQNNQCALALQRSSDTAKIQTYGVTRQAALALGYGGTVGRFVDKSTGATGYFTTSTFLAGVAGGSFAFEGAIYKGGLRNFVGGSDTASVGITTPIADIGFSSSRNISNGQEIGRGFTFSLKNPFTSPMSVGAEATGGFAVTEIFGCKVPK